MNAIINKLLLSGDKYIPEMYLKQHRFTFSICGPFTKNKERKKSFKKTSDSRYVYQNELDKSRFRHNMAYGDFKDLNRRRTAGKVLRNKTVNIANYAKYDGYQRGLVLMVFKFFESL